MTKPEILLSASHPKKVDAYVLLVSQKKEIFRKEILSQAPQWLDSVLEANSTNDSPEVFANVAWPSGPKHLVVLQLDRERRFALGEVVKTASAQALSHARSLGCVSIAFLLDGRDADDFVPWVAEGMRLGSYEFSRYRSQSQPKSVVERVVLAVRKEAISHLRRRLSEIEIVAQAQNFARDLVNEPPSVLGPRALCKQAQSVAREFALRYSVLGKAQLKRVGYHGILAVGQGADEEPCLIELHYAPKQRARHRVAIVGKAVMFDTGGYCIKPAKDMWRMKGDMAGGAAVLAAMKAIAQLRPNVEVYGLIPCAKNLVSARAFLPGDVIRTRIGKTVHVGNTDAEGRLLLMDAFIHAGEKKVAHLVDIATLTGSVVRALGPSVSGIFGNDQEWVQALISVGQRVGEDFWQLPLVEEYRDYLKNHVADLDNVGNKPDAGAIVAALFLREFVPDGVKWAHLDIAGPFLVERQWKYYGPGATGFGVRTLVGLLRSLQEN